MTAYQRRVMALLAGFFMVLAFVTAALTQVLPVKAQASGTGRDYTDLGKRLQPHLERIDAIRYSLPTGHIRNEPELPLSPAGQQSLDAIAKKAEAEAPEKIGADLGVVKSTYRFDGYEITSNTPTLIQVDLRYDVVRQTTYNTSEYPWEEIDTYGVDIDPATGTIVNLIHKDEEWIHEHMPNEESVLDDGLGSGDEGLTNEEMEEINRQSALHRYDS